MNNVFMWKSEGSLLVSDLSFHHAGKDQTHFLRQGSHPLYHTSSVTWEEEPSVEEFPPSDWPVSIFVMQFLNW